MDGPRSRCNWDFPPFFYVYQVPRLLQDGIQKQVFYILLFPWGISCAMALFGSLRSYARLTSKQLGSAIELGGPVVLFCLVVAGGFKLVPTPDTFNLTVRIHSGEEPIIRSGTVTIDFEDLRRTEPVYSNGEANFKGLPQKFWGLTVNVFPQVQGYRAIPQKAAIHNNVIDLALEKASRQTVLRGTVLPPPGASNNLRIVLDGQDVETAPDASGRFQMLIDGQEGDPVRLRVYSGGKLAYDDFQVLPGPVTLLLNH